MASNSKQNPKIVEVDRQQIEDVLARLDERDCNIIRPIVEAYLFLLDVLLTKKMTIARLLKMIFGSRTEKTADVLGEPDQTDQDQDQAGSRDEQQDKETGDSGQEPKPRPPGHGRHGADDYHGAQQVHVDHDWLHPGDTCPSCEQDTLYDTGRPGVLVRLVGQAPVTGTVYRLQKLRCKACGQLFTASPPPEAEGPKYDPTVASMIGLLKYGTGLPFNRQQRLQWSVGIPLAASTQWDLVHAKANDMLPAYAELIRQAAQGDIFYQDDTYAKILEFMGLRAQRRACAEDAEDDSPRKGIFTSGIVSTTQDRRIALFFTSRKHAGENLREVLQQRAAELQLPIQMCDALSRNMPEDLQTILANCLAHARRKFVDITELFRDECKYVLNALKVIYKNDNQAREEDLSPEERLEFHQIHSGPTMEALHAWLKQQLDDRLVEPNSALGEAITYMRKHWSKLTLFLRHAGAPLDNNICERALKKAILHRKNSLFFKTENGARVGDIFMTLIYTCELCGASPSDYLNQLHYHADQLARNPERWMPWNYRQTLSDLAAASDADCHASTEAMESVHG